MTQFRLFFVLLFTVLTSLQGQDLLTRYMESSHYKGEGNPDFTRKVKRMSKHRALSFEVEGGVRDMKTCLNCYTWKYNGTRNFNIIAWLSVKKVPGYNQTYTYSLPTEDWNWWFYGEVYGKSLRNKRYNGYVMWSTDTKYKFKDLTVEAARYNAFGERAGAGKKATKIKTSTSKVVIAGEAFQDQTFDIAPGAGKNDGKTYFDSPNLRTKGVFRMDKALIGKTITVTVIWRDSTGWESEYKLKVKIVE